MSDLVASSPETSDVEAQVARYLAHRLPEARGTTLPPEVLESVRRNKVALKGLRLIR